MVDIQALQDCIMHRGDGTASEKCADMSAERQRSETHSPCEQASQEQPAATTTTWENAKEVYLLRHAVVELARQRDRARQQVEALQTELKARTKEPGSWDANEHGHVVEKEPVSINRAEPAAPMPAEDRNMVHNPSAASEGEDTRGRRRGGGRLRRCLQMMREVWWWWIRQITRRRVGTRAVRKLAQRRLTQALHAFFAVVTREVDVREREREAFEAQQLRLQIHLQRLQLTSVAESITATATAVDMSPSERVPAEASTAVQVPSSAENVSVAGIDRTDKSDEMTRGSGQHQPAQRDPGSGEDATSKGLHFDMDGRHLSKEALGRPAVSALERESINIAHILQQLQTLTVENMHLRAQLSGNEDDAE